MNISNGTKDPYMTMKSYLGMGIKMDIAVLVPVLAILIVIGVGTTGFGLNTATQVDIMAMVAATGFLVPILMIALVSLRLNNKF